MPITNNEQNQLKKQCEITFPNAVYSLNGNSYNNPDNAQNTADSTKEIATHYAAIPLIV